MTSPHKYKPSIAQAIPWNELENFYNDLISTGWLLPNIVQLIQVINNNEALRNKLYACTSLDTLIISIYNPIELWREAIYIQYNKESRLWNFKYYPYPYRESEHERNYPSELLIEKFNNYIDLLRWR